MIILLVVSNMCAFDCQNTKPQIKRSGGEGREGEGGGGGRRRKGEGGIFSQKGDHFKLPHWL